jgi:hypothetical protein
MGFSSMLNSNFGILYFNQSYSSRDGILPPPWIDAQYGSQIWTKITLINPKQP